MKGNLLIAAFAALLTTSVYAHPRDSDELQFTVSVDVAEVLDQSSNDATLLFQGATPGDHFDITKVVNCDEFQIGKLNFHYTFTCFPVREYARRLVDHQMLCSPCFPS